jgi:hypothetical protein
MDQLNNIRYVDVIARSQDKYLTVVTNKENQDIVRLILPMILYVCQDNNNMVVFNTNPEFLS